MGFKSRFIIYWLPAVLGLALVFWMSSGTFSAKNTGSLIKPALSFLAPEISPHQAAVIHVWVRKSGHLFEYFLLGLLLFRAFRGPSESFSWRPSLFALLALIFLAAGEEFHQSLVPTRSASPVDVGIDAAGGMLAQVATALRFTFKEKIQRRSSPSGICKIYLADLNLQPQPVSRSTRL